MAETSEEPTGAEDPMYECVGGPLHGKLAPMSYGGGHEYRVDIGLDWTNGHSETFAECYRYTLRCRDDECKLVFEFFERIPEVVVPEIPLPTEEECKVADHVSFFEGVNSFARRYKITDRETALRLWNSGRRILDARRSAEGARDG